MRTEAKIILSGALMVVLFGMLSSAVMRTKASTSLTDSGIESAFSCTMDAKVCPDGSFVGRIPPYCQFAACPTATTLPFNE